MNKLAFRAGVVISLSALWASARAALAEDGSARTDAQRPTDRVVSCDAPFEGRALDARSNETSKERWYRVATSRATAGVIAVWNENQVAVSRDDGRTFHRLKAAFEKVDDVVVGASGTVFVLDGSNISIGFAYAQRLRRVAVPQANEGASLAVGGGYLGYASRGGISLTKDYGASWQLKHFPDDQRPGLIQLTIEADGTLDAKLTIENCHSGDYDLFFRASLQAPWEAACLGRP